MDKECDGMKRIVAFILLTVMTFALTACNASENISGISDVPEDFSFALTWNVYGISSFDSQTGKLIKTKDATNPDDYVTYYQLTDEERACIYDLIVKLNANSYPDVYDPSNGLSKPSMTLMLTVRMNGREKTIQARNISLEHIADNEMGQLFLDTCKDISELLMDTEEWKSLPEYEVLYR